MLILGNDNMLTAVSELITAKNVNVLIYYYDTDVHSFTLISFVLA